MKFLIALTILNTAINAIKYGSNILQATDIDQNEATYNHTSSSFTLNDRFRRAPTDDVMKQSVERMQMISRLTNAIYLQTELSNGATIKIDKLISELLHFGSTTPTSIHAIKENEVESALADLENLPGQIEESRELTTLENTFNIVEGIRNAMPDVKDIQVWPGKPEYEADMNKLKDGKIDISFITSLDDHCAGHKVAFPKVMNYQAPYKDSYKDTVNDLKVAWSGILTAGSELKKGIPQLFTFINKKNAQDSFDYMIQLKNGINKFQKDQGSLTTNPNGVKKLQSNVENIMKTVNGLKTITNDLKLVNDFLMAYSTKSLSTPIEYTIGLPDGYNDINQMINHFNNPWFAETVKDKKLEEAFRRLKMWRPSVDNILKPLDKITEEKVKKISEVFVFSDQLVTDFSSFDGKDAKAVDDCITNMPNKVVDPKEINALEKLANDIDIAIKTISDSLSDIRDYIGKNEHQSILKMAVEVCDTVKDETSFVAAVKTFNEDTKLKDLQTVFGELKQKVDAITSTHIVTLKKHATDSVNKFKAVDAYLQGMNTLAPVLNCFLISKTFVKAKTVVSHTEKTRKLKGDSGHKNKFESAAEVVKIVAGTKTDLKSLEDSIKGMKGFKSKESDYLNLLKDVVEHYKVIGLSTEGVVGLKRVIDRKSDLDILKQQATLITDETKNNAKSLDPDEKKLLDGLASLHTSLDPLFTSLNTWKDEVSKLNMTTLPNYSMVFTTAKAVSPLAPDIEKMGSALDKLIELVTTPNKKELLKKVRNSLKILVGVGMKYASYTKNFDQSEKSLKALDLFFVSRFARASVTPAPSFSSNGNSGGGGQAAQSEPPVADSSFPQIWMIISIVVAFFVLLSIGICGFLWCKDKMRKTNKQQSNFHNLIIPKRMRVKFLVETKYQMSRILKGNGTQLVQWSKNLWQAVVNNSAHGLQKEVTFRFRNNSKRLLKGNCDPLEMWGEVWEYKCTDIVMLCQTNECNQYFLDIEGQEVVYCNAFFVTCTKREVKGDVIIRTLSVKFRITAEIRTVIHYQHTGYAANLPPASADGFIMIWNKVNIKESIAVQCADGAMRTGAFIMLEMMYHDIYFSPHQNGKIEFAEVIRTFREWRLADTSHIHFAYALHVLLEIFFRDPNNPREYIDLHDTRLSCICAGKIRDRREFLGNVRNSLRQGHADAN